jgi:hypothetical protein
LLIEDKGMMQIKQLQLRKTVFNCFNNICFSDTFFSKSESPQEKESLGKSVKHLVESLSKFIINGLVCFVLSTSTALAMSPAPPAPAPSPIPPIDPTPGTPQLAIELIQTKIILEWNGTQHAQYYPVYAYTEGQWQHIENIYGTRAFYDLGRRGWDGSELAFKILACKRPNFLTVCSAYSNTVQLKDYLPPQAPNLSLATENNKISLTWDSVYRAQYYQIEIYKQYNWHPLITVSSTNYNSAYQNDWDLDDVEFRVKACDSSNACGNYSDSIKLSDQLPLVSPSFGLSSYPQTLLSGSLGLIDEASELAFDERKEMTRYIVATLRLTDSNTQAVQDIDWPIYIDTSDFTVTSNKTISVRPGNYNIAFLAVDADVTYTARALNVTLSETEQNIPLELKTVLGDTNVSIDAVIPLPEFKFQYDPEELTDFTQPKLSVLIDDGDEVLLTLNPDTGITDQYLSISPGPHNIRLRFYDGALLKGGSDPDQEDVNIVPAEPFEMDLIPLKGKTTASLDMVGGEAVFNFAIPAVVINEVGGNPDDLRVLLSLVGLNNQPEDVVLSNLTYNSSSDNYEAEHTFTDMQADTQMTLSLSFTDLSTEPDQLLGTCVVGSFVLNTEPRTTPCQLTLRRRAIVGGHLMAVLGINVFDANYAPVRGVSVYARRLGLDTQNDTNEDDLGTLLGLTGSGTFGTSGYLEAYLVKGNYELTAKYVPVDGTAQETISLKAFDVKNQDLVLDKVVSSSIAITAPSENVTVDESYVIQWIASDPDDQASISIYYDTDNSGYDGTLITDSLVEGIDTSYTWDTSLLPSGDYYIYAEISDGNSLPVKYYSTGKITINRIPSITVTAPATDAMVGTSYTISWVASDPDNQATVSLYYDTDNSGYDGTLITGSLFEGIHSSYTWNTSSLSSGDYYIYAKIDDGISPQAYDYGTGKITLNVPPSITLTGLDKTVTVSAIQKLTWIANDPDDNANISLFYDTDINNHDGTLITENLLEDNHISYNWDTSALSNGEYHVYARIDDGINEPTYKYADGKIVVVPIKLNDTGIGWGANYPSGNNTNCGGEDTDDENIISQQDCSHGRDARAATGDLSKVGSGLAGFDFTRLDSNGNEYSGNEDYNSEPWACVRDNNTGLIWEVKTDDNGTHSKDATYRWGGETAAINASAREDGWGEFYDDWNSLIEDSNSESLCGLSNWRVPTVSELKSIVSSEGSSPPTDDHVYVDINYFPNHYSGAYWTASPSVYDDLFAWCIYFNSHGRSWDMCLRSNSDRLRLVHDGE